MKQGSLYEKKIIIIISCKDFNPHVWNILVQQNQEFKIVKETT